MDTKIQEWLDKQGYPLEMRVAKELHLNNIKPLQSNYYSDPNSNKKREIDVVGQLMFKLNDYNIIFQFVIECKNNSEKPWITFSSKTHTISLMDFVLNRPATKIGRKYLRFIHDNALLSSRLFDLPAIFSYNATQAFSNDSDQVYTAIMSVLNAIHFRENTISNEATYSKNCEIYFPIIVIGGKLFDCYLNTENETVLNEVNHKYLLWTNNVLGDPNTIIEIMTFEGLKEKVTNLEKQISDLVQYESRSFFDSDHSNSNFDTVVF